MVGKSNKKYKKRGGDSLDEIVYPREQQEEEKEKQEEKIRKYKTDINTFFKNFDKKEIESYKQESVKYSEEKSKINNEYFPYKKQNRDEYEEQIKKFEKKYKIYFNYFDFINNVEELLSYYNNFTDFKKGLNNFDELYDLVLQELIEEPNSKYVKYKTYQTYIEYVQSRNNEKILLLSLQFIKIINEINIKEAEKNTLEAENARLYAEQRKQEEETARIEEEKQKKSRENVLKLGLKLVKNIKEKEEEERLNQLDNFVIEKKNDINKKEAKKQADEEKEKADEINDKENKRKQDEQELINENLGDKMKENTVSSFIDLINEQEDKGFIVNYVETFKDYPEYLKILFNSKSNNNTPLGVAIYNKNYDVIKLLLDNGADPNIEIEYLNYETTPLHYACYTADKDLFDILIDSKKIKNFNIQDKYGNNTPLMAACTKCENIEIVKKLIEDGVDINERNGEIIYHEGKIEPVENPEGFTPLMIASQKGCTDIVSLLVDNKADITKTVTINKKNYTATELVYKKTLEYPEEKYNECFKYLKNLNNGIKITKERKDELEEEFNEQRNRANTSNLIEKQLVTDPPTYNKESLIKVLKLSLEFVNKCEIDVLVNNFAEEERNRIKADNEYNERMKQEENARIQEEIAKRVAEENEKRLANEQRQVAETEGTSIESWSKLLKTTQNIIEIIDKTNVNKKDTHGNTALIDLVKNYNNIYLNEDYIEYLNNIGVDPNIQNNDGNTALHEAVLSDNDFLVNRLLGLENINVNIQNNDGYTPLYNNLLYKVNLEIVNSLLSNKADVNIRNNNGSSVLCKAFYNYIDATNETIESINLKVIDKLLEKGATMSNTEYERLYGNDIFNYIIAKFPKNKEKFKEYKEKYENIRNYNINKLVLKSGLKFVESVHNTQKDKETSQLEREEAEPTSVAEPSSFTQNESDSDEPNANESDDTSSVSSLLQNYNNVETNDEQTTTNEYVLKIALQFVNSIAETSRKITEAELQQNTQNENQINDNTNVLKLALTFMNKIKNNATINATETTNEKYLQQEDNSLVTTVVKKDDIHDNNTSNVEPDSSINPCNIEKDLEAFNGCPDNYNAIYKKLALKYHTDKKNECSDTGSMIKLNNKRDECFEERDNLNNVYESFNLRYKEIEKKEREKIFDEETCKNNIKLLDVNYTLLYFSEDNILYSLDRDIKTYINKNRNNIYYRIKELQQKIMSIKNDIKQKLNDYAIKIIDCVDNNINKFLENNYTQEDIKKVLNDSSDIIKELLFSIGLNTDFSIVYKRENYDGEEIYNTRTLEYVKEYVKKIIKKMEEPLRKITEEKEKLAEQRQSVNNANVLKLAEEQRQSVNNSKVLKLALMFIENIYGKEKEAQQTENTSPPSNIYDDNETYDETDDESIDNSQTTKKNKNVLNLALQFVKLINVTNKDTETPLNSVDKLNNNNSALKIISRNNKNQNTEQNDKIKSTEVINTLPPVLASQKPDSNLTAVTEEEIIDIEIPDNLFETEINAEIEELRKEETCGRNADTTQAPPNNEVEPKIQESIWKKLISFFKQDNKVLPIDATRETAEGAFFDSILDEQPNTQEPKYKPIEEDKIRLTEYIKKIASKITQKLPKCNFRDLAPKIDTKFMSTNNLIESLIKTVVTDANFSREFQNLFAELMKKTQLSPEVAVLKNSLNFINSVVKQPLEIMNGEVALSEATAVEQPPTTSSTTSTATTEPQEQPPADTLFQSNQEINLQPSITPKYTPQNALQEPTEQELIKLYDSIPTNVCRPSNANEILVGLQSTEDENGVLDQYCIYHDTRTNITRKEKSNNTPSSTKTNGESTAEKIEMQPSVGITEQYVTQTAAQPVNSDQSVTQTPAQPNNSGQSVTQTTVKPKNSGQTATQTITQSQTDASNKQPLKTNMAVATTVAMNDVTKQPDVLQMLPLEVLAAAITVAINHTEKSLPPLDVLAATTTVAMQH